MLGRRKPIERPLSLELISCSKYEADVGVYSYFKNIEEGYKYYKFRAVNLANMKEKFLLFEYLKFIRAHIAASLDKTWYQYKKKPTKYIRSRAIEFSVEPVGQGSMSTISDSKGIARILLDAGHGTPIDKKVVSNKNYKFNGELSGVEVVFLSHWDEDHFQLANHPEFSYLKDKFWFVPFSIKAICSYSMHKAFCYEPRLLVWETLFDITRNINFYIIDHGITGTVSIGANKTLRYECGSECRDSNDRGIVITYEQRNKYSWHNVLVPGDADYCNFPKICSSAYTDVIATHHGSANLRSKELPHKTHIGAKFILSFGFNDHYKHPSSDMIEKAIDSGFCIYPTSLINWHSYRLNKAQKLSVFNLNACRVKVI